MKKYTILIALMLIIGGGIAQNIVYGYPPLNYRLKSNDFFIVNLPENMDGRFITLLEFDEIINLLETNPTLHFKFEINIFFGGPKINNLIYAENLEGSFCKIIKYKSKVSNYEVIPRGSDNAIFLNENHPNYKAYNSRIEIYVVSLDSLPSSE